MTPVDVLKDKLLGSGALIDHDTTVPPLIEGEALVIAVPLVSVKGDAA
jgi:hypothetical protein